MSALTLRTPVENWGIRKIPPHQIMRGKYCTLEPSNLDQHAKALFDNFQEDESGEDWTYLPNEPFTHYEEFKT